MELNNFLGLENRYCQQADSYFEIISIPYERTTSYGKGTSNGPDAIINASQYVELYDEQFRIEAYKKGVFTSGLVDVDGSVENVFENIEQKLSSCLKEGKFPIGLGGEHAITICAFFNLMPILICGNHTKVVSIHMPVLCIGSPDWAIRSFRLVFVLNV